MRELYCEIKQEAMMETMKRRWKAKSCPDFCWEQYMLNKRVERDSKVQTRLGAYRDPEKTCLFCAHLIVIDK